VTRVPLAVLGLGGVGGALAARTGALCVGTERTVDAVISRLRRKVEDDPSDPELLLTAWGVGYKFADGRD